MACHLICNRYKVKRNGRRGHYQSGHKRCNGCEVFMKIDSARCPCCNQILRTIPHSRKNKELLAATSRI